MTTEKFTLEIDGKTRNIDRFSNINSKYYRRTVGVPEVVRALVVAQEFLNDGTKYDKETLQAVRGASLGDALHSLSEWASNSKASRADYDKEYELAPGVKISSVLALNAGVFTDLYYEYGQEFFSVAFEASCDEVPEAKDYLDSDDMTLQKYQNTIEKWLSFSGDTGKK